MWNDAFICEYLWIHTALYFSVSKKRGHIDQKISRIDGNYSSSSSPFYPLLRTYYDSVLPFHLSWPSCKEINVHKNKIKRFIVCNEFLTSLIFFDKSSILSEITNFLKQTV